MNINKTIHEAMGLCWHMLGRLKQDKDGRYVSCDKCEKRLKVGVWSVVSENPDYVNPDKYCELFNWMREEDRFRIFGNWLMRTHGDSQFRFLMKSRKEQITLIAEAIEAGVLK